ncbi:hypothetical protein LVD15_13535 [Fulvivirga maritima]|uniref:hypothetical protein n=1 Tax=Fulvivirga maritima TaxID=2904247 RepID=UPI001F32DF6E|nr:hypothetical protein [Fulvivirga maritima]UII29406.1 hypothetical protein LVD15_13535 [Fulvivirga maritima]
MKTKLIITTLALAIIASFSFITVKRENISKNTKQKSQKHTLAKPMSGFTMEDQGQF